MRFVDKEAAEQRREPGDKDEMRGRDAPFFFCVKKTRFAPNRERLDNNLKGGVLMKCKAWVFVSSCLIATTALADPNSVTVHCGDLNLNTAQGLHVLEGRINSAAHQVCNYWGNEYELLVQTLKDQKCVHDTAAGAMREVQIRLAHAELGQPLDSLIVQR
jgi:UrcA family protein